MHAIDVTLRFSDRVDDYARFRPGYPPEILDLLRERCGLTPQAEIADIGFGTGLFTRLLLENGNRVTGIEPNQNMLEAGLQHLAHFSNFSGIQARAEQTTLQDNSVDFVTAAQAAHWFEPQRARKEFLRILKLAGWVVLVWNERLTSGTPFLSEYEQFLLTHGTDYSNVRHERTTDRIAEFFAPSSHELEVFRTEQVFDLEGLEGRVFSSSYVPVPTDPRSGPLRTALHDLFDRHNVNGTVRFLYDTKVFFSQLT
jgi:SAM-dependent methyltransferase